MTDQLLDVAIAKQLSDSNVGLFRAQLAQKIDATLFDGNPDKISSALNTMLKAGYIDKSARQGLDGCRWSLTPRGRAAYSVLHDDSVSELAKPIGELPIKPYPPSLITAMETADNVHGKTEQPMTLDPAYEIDAILIGLIHAIHKNAAPMIERKAEKIALLERLENDDIFPGDLRALLGFIRMDLQQLDAE